jgi:hypothetical protein
VVSALARQAHGEDWPGVAAFLNEFEDPSTQALISGAAAGGRELPNPELQLPDVAAKLRNAALDREMADLNRRIGDPGISEADRIAVLRRQQEIRSEKREALPPAAT